jgi:hypothetical protein
VQRLFSTFASGWPGTGLLLQRILTATLLLRLGIANLAETSFSISSLPQFIGSIAGTLLFAGLWTPIAGILIAVVELWIATTQTGDPCISIILATLGVTAAMIGPGAWSLDARLFGRKHLVT